MRLLQGDQPSCSCKLPAKILIWPRVKDEERAPAWVYLLPKGPCSPWGWAAASANVVFRRAGAWGRLAASVPAQPTACRVRLLQPGTHTCPAQGSTAGHPWPVLLNNPILPNAYTASEGYFTDVAKPNPQALGFSRAALKVLKLDTPQVPVESLMGPCSMQCQGWACWGSCLGLQRFRGLLGTVMGLWQRAAGRDRAGWQWH